MFSALLKKLRSEKNLTQGQLAKEVGVSPGNVGDWETGKSKPGYNALASLARIFEVSADYLLEIEPSPAKASDDLFAHQKTAGLICDGSPLEGEEADLIAMYRLLSEEQREDMVHLLLRHTTTLGVRETRHRRYTLSRTEDTVDSPWGPVARKTSQGWGVRRQKPEFEDLARIAREQDLTLDHVRDGLK